MESHPPAAAAASYSTSYEPVSPRTATHRITPISSPIHPYPPALPGPYSLGIQNRRAFMAARVRHLLTPRVLMPVLLWLVSLWAVHRYLFALPFPSWGSDHASPVAEAGATQDLTIYNIPPRAPEFPEPALRKGEDARDSVHPLYRPFSPLSQPEAPFPVLRPTRFLPKQCLESWFIFGELTCGPEELGNEDKLDATWLWVNGTDKRWFEDMKYWSAELGVHSPAKHFREQNELKYSVRSVVKALKRHLGTVHLVLYDYAFNSTTDMDLLPESTTALLEQQFGLGPRHKEGGVSQSVSRHLADNWRIVQTPRWLNFSALEPSTRNTEADDEYPTFRYAAHSEIFHLPTTGDGEDTEAPGEQVWKEQVWREKALPTFNSMAIESRLGWLPGLADVSIALNDDFFVLREMSVSDFHSLLYGNVIRFDSIYTNQVKPEMTEKSMTESGENGGLYHANYLLSKRYPRRLRPYFAHAPKVITRNLHHEASIMFEDPITLSSTRRFRETKIGVSDVQIQWLLTSLRVERWREALLWTWVVANHGAKNGLWDEDARQAIKDLFGMTERDDDVAQIEVHRGERWTIRKDRINELFAQAGWGAPKATDYLFSSMDGHLPPVLPPGRTAKDNDICVLDLDYCFGPWWLAGSSVPATQMFKRLTFEKPECGDCLIMALTTASGPLGLSAFFPPPNTKFFNPVGEKLPEYLSPPHLPLTPTWQEADFSLENVMATTAQPGQDVDLREYSMYLLSRYLYVSGKSPTNFHMLRQPSQARFVFNNVLDKRPDIAVLGLNDDIELHYDQVRQIMNDWFESRWPEPAVWERA